MSKYQQITAPANLPLTLDEVKAHLAIDGYADNDYLTLLITAGTNYLQALTGVGLVTAQYEEYYDRMTYRTELSIRPVLSVDSITYVDNLGVVQTLDASLYQPDLYGIVPEIYVAHPLQTAHQPNCMTIKYTAGYAACPADLKLALLAWIGQQFEVREISVEGRPYQQMPWAFESIIESHRVKRI
jgi:uncharacterized phiE125 gp8 family phage protein